eukprot:TRINITY_DN10353_c0_g1_i1.p1 TRINITY_DN10353_c0_g1~~TRINITY_DN10353_c0_g1_i1.p1  ORF type:complete len:115 (+),score=3.41 TRINITY_DN10353_c0_g1_i1:2-346(+)
MSDLVQGGRPDIDMNPRRCLETFETIQWSEGDEGKRICRSCKISEEDHVRHGLSPVETPRSRIPGKGGKIRGRIWEMEMKLHVAWFEPQHQVYDLIVDIWRAAAQLYPRKYIAM